MLHATSLAIVVLSHINVPLGALESKKTTSAPPLLLFNPCSKKDDTLVCMITAK
jgi:hypothetical protein